MRSWDDYGSVLNFNYKGQEIFRTIPGALVSLIVWSLFAIYFVFKAQVLITNDGWDLLTVNTALSAQDINKEINLSTQTNMSFGIVIEPNPMLILNETEYHRKCSFITNVTEIVEYGYR